MNIICEFFVCLFCVIKALCLSTFRFLLPRKEKCVRREVVLITDTLSDIGRLVALEFAKRGAKVVGWAFNDSSNSDLEEQIKCRGGQFYSYVCDVSDLNRLEEVAEKVKLDVGEVTILINNASIAKGGQFLDSSDEMINKTMNINLISHYWTVKKYLPSMVANNHGHIVSISTSAGLFGFSGLTDYCASQFGGQGFMESLMYELLDDPKCNNIHTTLICSHFINSGMFSSDRTRFSPILPTLDMEYAAQRITRAILTNEKVVYIPRILYWLAFLRCILPTPALILLNKFIRGQSTQSSGKDT